MMKILLDLCGLVKKNYVSLYSFYNEHYTISTSPFLHFNMNYFVSFSSWVCCNVSGAKGPFFGSVTICCGFSLGQIVLCWDHIADQMQCS